MGKVSMQALKVFDVAARHSSFKVAAQELNISATAVSHHVSNLESRLGVKLFIRKTREVCLTDIGLFLAKATDSGFSTIEHAINALQTQSQKVKVQTTSSFAAQFLIPQLRTLSQSYPDLEVEIVTGEQLIHDPHAISIRFGEINNVAKSAQLTRESFNIYGTEECLNKLTNNDCVKVFIPKWKSRLLPSPPWQQWLNHNKLDLNKLEVVYFDQESYCIDEAIAGSGLAFCSNTLIQYAVSTKILRQCDYPSQASQLGYYLVSASVSSTQKQQQFLAWLQAHFD
ncbi:LysR family transcriptional regulator [Pseudoalteromonas luteoviolacea]|uniref:LysR family transcriptional regulator n=1 Tax=Pseudoalteromonas luteoviolacea TaxID=43657 RepID=UPI001153F06C|nr:LysR family transcriptional regulator [Pseudoalteromonas luteoviolacea]TQF71085.1 LysR family transcriptional regulator [Pseudoalteromonas luteoviolacea]